MPLWSPPYKIRRSNKMLSFAVRQNVSALEVFGESCFLLKRYERADMTFQKDNRRTSTITKTVTSGSYTVDSETGYLQYKLWGRNTDPTDEYPDIGVFTNTVTVSGSTSVWEKAVDKYSFINGRAEYTWDIWQDRYDANQNKLEDSVYVVYNTPPFTTSAECMFTFGTVNPLIDFYAMQPIRDNEPNFYTSAFGYQQWLNENSRIRTKRRKHRFLICFPDKITDFSFTDTGLVRDSSSSYWAAPPPYGPELMEHDVIVRESTGQRFQVISMTKIYVEDIYCGQNFDLAELDPRSSVYQYTLEM